MPPDRKPKLYFDTTIPNYLVADDRPSRRETTRRVWGMCESGECEVFVSDVFYRELRRCHEPKLGQMLLELSAITLNHLEETDEVRALAVGYVKSGVLKEKDFNDCLHIAHAVVHGCDAILSWNFNHIVNDVTRGRVKAVNAVGRYNGVGIASPEEFLMGDIMTDTDNTMEALQKIKKELSLRYLSQTPEERKRDAREDKEWFEKMTGKPVRTADHSRRRVADEEPAQV